MTSNIWFSSDIHFGHENILKKFCPSTRLGDTTDEMDNIIINNIQAQVQPGDTLYWLGDIFFCRADRAISIMKRLPVRPKLIWGNHDQVIEDNATLRSYFDILGHWADIKINGQRVILHHFPTYEWHKMHAGAYHLYGHIHSHYGHLEHPGIPGRCMDVGIDSRPGKDMTMWSWKEVNEILSKRTIRGHGGTEMERGIVKQRGEL